jgi:DNA excision repair protein ERCC-2
LSLDVSNWVDVIIGDYNYVFDPTVMLQRYFDEGRAKHVVLIDEAHNLVDRSREMYSAPLAMTDLAVAPGTRDGKAGAKARRSLAATRDQLQALLRSASTGLPPAKAYHQGAFAAEAIPESFIESLRGLAGAIEGFLIEQSSREAALPWLEPFFAVYRFLQVSDDFDDTYRLIIDPGTQSVTLFCVDPSKRLTQTLKGLRSAVFFSATLSPLDYFIDVLGGSPESARGSYASPFRSDQMAVRVAPLNISFQERGRSMDSVVEAIRRHLRENPGNNLIYCPSLAYLDQLHQKLTASGTLVDTSHFHGGSEVVGKAEHHSREMLILRKVTGDDDQLGADPPRLGCGHRSVDPHLSGLVAGRSHNSPAFASDGYCFTPKPRICRLLA